MPPKKTKGDMLVASLARIHTEAAIDTLSVLMKTAENDATKVSAANALLDRGWGKPKENIKLDADVSVDGSVEHRGLPVLMDAIASEVQRTRTKDSLPTSGSNEPVLSPEVPAQPA